MRFMSTRRIPPFSHRILQPCKIEKTRGVSSGLLFLSTSIRCETHALPQPNIHHALHEIRRDSRLVIRREERRDGRRRRRCRRVEGTNVVLVSVVDERASSLSDPATFDGLLDELDEINFREIHRLSSRSFGSRAVPAELGEVEDVVHGFDEGVSTGLDGLEVRRLLSREPGVCEEFRRNEDAVERRSQLVGDVADEGRLGLIGEGEPPLENGAED